MKYVIGIDGGGTKTILKLADLEGNILFSVEGGPTNLNSSKQEEVTGTLKKLFIEAINFIGGNMENCSCLCIGVAGADRCKEKTIIENLFKSIGYDNEIIVTNDAVTAFYGGIEGKEGVIVISGTGSICYGRNSKGEAYRAGGWGHILGDEGSAYDIGLNALKYIMRCYDKKDKETLLYNKILKYLNMDSPDELIEFVYRRGNAKSKIAGLAFLVDEAYKSGDEVAENILCNAAHELFENAFMVINRLGLRNKNSTIGVGGSVFNNNKYIYDVFNELVDEKLPLATVTHLINDAAVGAVFLALNKANGGG